MVTPIEIRLSGSKDTTLVGIVAALNRQLRSGPCARVELRYSTENPAPIAPNAATQAIAKLLREKGNMAEISVRQHDNRIENASGDLLLRVFPVQAARPAEHVPVARPRWWHGLLRRLLPARWRPAAGAQAAGREPQGMHSTVAIEHLRKAVALAAAYIETESGSTMAGPQRATANVGQARVVVRSPLLHAVLRPLVDDDPQGAAVSIGRMVAAQGLALAPGFAVGYEFRPRSTGDGTRYGGEPDIEVVLRAAAAAPAAAAANAEDAPKPGVGASIHCAPGRIEPTLDGQAAAPGMLPGRAAAALASTALPLPPDSGTLMPARRPAALLTVRVLGTTQQAFDPAFELRFDALPARFDRDALAQAGFATLHGALLRLVSNTSPLIVCLNSAGQPVLRVACRHWPQGGTVAMYHHAHTLAPLDGELALPAPGLRLIVNAPGGVPDPASGNWLPALLIDVLPGAGLVAAVGTSAPAQAA